MKILCIDEIQQLGADSSIEAELSFSLSAFLEEERVGHMIRSETRLQQLAIE